MRVKPGRRWERMESMTLDPSRETESSRSAGSRPALRGSGCNREQQLRTRAGIASAGAELRIRTAPLSFGGEQTERELLVAGQRLPRQPGDVELDRQALLGRPLSNHRARSRLVGPGNGRFAPV